jgi:nucleotidyltransferase substrate binding protein (TIGR01987 family)
MQEEISYAVKKFKDSVQSLKEGIFQAQDELDKDGVIQRFEFTFELLWKTLKIFLEGEGIECLTPKECLKSAFRVGLIENEQIALDMLEDRNKTSHTYDKEESQKIFKKIEENYFPFIQGILNKLEDRNIPKC